MENLHFFLKWELKFSYSAQITKYVCLAMVKDNSRKTHFTHDGRHADVMNWLQNLKNTSSLQGPKMQEMQEMWIRSLGREDPLEKGMAICSSILAWRISWTEEPSGLYSMVPQRVGHDWARTMQTKSQSSRTSECDAVTYPFTVIIKLKLGDESGPPIQWLVSW